MKRPAPAAIRAPLKRHRIDKTPKFNKIATFENAAAVDENPPLKQLESLMERNKDATTKGGDAVVYWMRLQDLRVHDNRALSLASKTAKRIGVPLLSMFAISPQDYHAHDRGPRRIDFMLRNLVDVQQHLAKLDIPLYVFTHARRKTLPERVMELMGDWGVKHLYGNIEYEVDELRRDIRVATLAKERNIHAEFIHDRPVVNPGLLKTKQGKDYAVYSPWQRSWLEFLNGKLALLDEASPPSANNSSIRQDERFGELFESKVPESVEGFECHDTKEMANLWPAGTDAAKDFLHRFLHSDAVSIKVSQGSGRNDGMTSSNKSRIGKYSDGRDRADIESTSKLSPYLASGIIPARHLIRETMAYNKSKHVQGGRDSGLGMWVQEVAWRDFYTHVLCAFPRVSMGRPYQEKFASVKWEVNEEHLKAWQEGKTGVPIVDAAMRQLNTTGWMHNRCRMITAMYLTKDLMLDWRLGEKYFMQNLMDGDLGSNNGGWQWSASTGTDPQPYFRIFNPYNQSEKADPSGDYIRHFVPELRNLKGKIIHNPRDAMPSAEFKRLGYPEPLVDHKVARERALRRYKNPGET